MEKGEIRPMLRWTMTVVCMIFLFPIQHQQQLSLTDFSLLSLQTTQTPGHALAGHILY
jgi:hypothetical protein